MKNFILMTAALAMTLASIGLADAAPRPAPHRQRVGVLSCQIAGGVGLVLGSRRAVDCILTHRNGNIEHYRGHLGKVGIDIGFTAGSRLKWVVVNTRAARVGDGALAGNFVGVSANVAAGLGLGGNVLIGGSTRNIALQPLSGKIGTGMNVAAGISRLRLEAVPLHPIQQPRKRRN